MAMLEGFVVSDSPDFVLLHDHLINAMMSIYDVVHEEAKMMAECYIRDIKPKSFPSRECIAELAFYANRGDKYSPEQFSFMVSLLDTDKVLKKLEENGHTCVKAGMRYYMIPNKNILKRDESNESFIWRG